MRRLSYGADAYSTHTVALMSNGRLSWRRLQAESYIISLRVTPPHTRVWGSCCTTSRDARLTVTRVHNYLVLDADGETILGAGGKRLGSLALWFSGSQALWIFGSGSLDLWLSGSLDFWLLAIWISGSLALRISGSWLYGSLASGSLLVSFLLVSARLCSPLLVSARLCSSLLVSAEADAADADASAAADDCYTCGEAIRLALAGGRPLSSS